MSNDVAYYSWDEVNAPVLNNAAGSLLAVLDACGISGFNPKSVASLVVSGGVATATISGGHGYSTDRMLDIAGVTSPTALNGRKRITVTGANTYTFPAPGVADGTATGTITCKRSPFGLTKVATGTNKAIYGRSDSAANPNYLRVLDTATGNAAGTHGRVLSVESYSDVDTYTAPSPTSSFEGLIWEKGANDATAKRWFLIADSRAFWLFTDSSTYPFSTYGALIPQGWGDLVDFRAGSPYGTFIAGETSLGSATVFNGYGHNSSGGPQAALSLQRASNGLGGTIRSYCVYPASSASGVPIGGDGPAYPSDVDNGMPILPQILVAEDRSAQKYPIRGALPGLWTPLATVPTSMHLQWVTGIVGTDRAIMCLSHNRSSNVGAVLLDTTGPWR